MLYIEYLFEFMMSALRGLDEENSTKSYVISILAKLFGMVVITGILFGIVAILLLMLDGINEGSSILVLFKYFILLYAVASLPSLLDTFRSLRTTKNRNHKSMCMYYVASIIIFGVILHFGGYETFFGLLDV